MELSETGHMVYFHESKQLIVFIMTISLPCSTYLVIQILFTHFGQVWFFKKGFKRKKNAAKLKKLFYHDKFTFLS